MGQRIIEASNFLPFSGVRGFLSCAQQLDKSLSIKQNNSTVKFISNVYVKGAVSVCGRRRETRYR
jgi:hypothetical protein